MNLKLTGKSIKTAEIVLAAALVIGTLGLAAAFASNSNDAVQKDTVMSVSVPEVPSDNQLTRYQSTYYVNGGSEIVIVQRDLATGNPVSGTMDRGVLMPAKFTIL